MARRMKTGYAKLLGIFLIIELVFSMIFTGFIGDWQNVFAADSQSCTVTFNPWGGSGEKVTQKVSKNGYATAPQTSPTREGYEFAGWYLGDEVFDFETTKITEDITLHAQWDLTEKVYQRSGKLMVGNQTVCSVGETVIIRNDDNYPGYPIYGYSWAAYKNYNGTKHSGTAFQASYNTSGNPCTFVAKEAGSCKVECTFYCAIFTSGSDTNAYYYLFAEPVKTINLQESMELSVGESDALTYTTEPSGGYTWAVSELKFSSDDEKVATVDESTGVVTAVGNGTTKIKLKTKQGEVEVCQVTVGATTEPEISDTPQQSGKPVPSQPSGSEVPTEPDTSVFEYETNADGTLNITGYTGEVAQLVIPSGIDGKTVTSIGKEDESVFGFHKEIISLNILEGIQSIMGYGDFVDCTNLEHVTLPTTLKNIGQATFYGCEKLQSISIPNDVSEIPEYLFCSCTNLKEIYLPSGINAIGEAAFLSCDNLTTIYYGGSQEDWKQIEVEGQNEILKKANIIYNASNEDINEPESSQKPDNTAEPLTQDTLVFEYEVQDDGTLLITGYKGKAANLLIPAKIDGKTVKGIGDEDGVFANHSELLKVTISEGIEELGYGTFAYCTNLTYVSMPATLKKLHDTGAVFYGCERLKSIAIPDGITYIPEYMFYGCKSLEEIYLPKSLEEIGEYAFGGCDSLTTIYYGGSRKEWRQIEIEENNMPLDDADIIYHASYDELKKSDRQMKGDIDFDGEISLLDVQIALRVYLDLEVLEDSAIEAGDIDGDGDISLNDVQAILQYYLGIIDSFE